MNRTTLGPWGEKTREWATEWAGLFLLLLSGCNGSASATDLGGSGPGGSGPTVVIVQCDADSDCDDGRACNGVEECDAGACAKGEAVDCNDGVGCTFDSCDQSTGKCSHTAPDEDGDGSLDRACLDAEGEALGDDCDDFDAHRFPGNAETCGETTADVDEDCDPATFGEVDVDDDGYVDEACFNTADDGEIFGGEDCDDAARPVNPDTAEVCDGFDNNCDGEIDEGLRIVGYKDKDGDGYGVPITAAEVVPGEVVDGDGLLHVCPGTPAFAELSIDCNDTDPLVRPDLFELCDEVDNDCDGEVDENPVPLTWYWDGDHDGFGNPKGPLKASCERQDDYSIYPEDCDDTSALSSPLQVELCDGKDNDCDGVADYFVAAGDLEDDDEDGAPDAACGTAAPDCDDQDEYTHPGAIELCDGVDNDCNGAPDTLVQTVLWYLDEDGDGWGNPLSPPVGNCDVVDDRVTKAGDCDDRDPTRNPGLSDDCSGVPGWDDDCDGSLDEAEANAAFFQDFDGDGYGKLGSTPLFACSQPAGWAAIAADCDDTDDDASPVLEEVCSLGDGRDDDCDGDIDCADTDCLTADDCVGFFQVDLVAPAEPVVAIVATPFTATVSVATAEGTPIPGYALGVTCLDGAYSPDTSVVTDELGLADVTIYPGLALGSYECLLSGDTTAPFTLEMQAVGPNPGTVHTTFNVPLANTGTLPIDGASTLGAELWNPTALEVDADGTAYVLSTNLFEVSPRGAVRDLLASIGTSVSAVDLALDREAQVLYLLAPSAVFALDLEADLLTKVVGGGALGFSEGMSALDIALQAPHHLVHHPEFGLTVVDQSLGFLILREDGSLTRWDAHFNGTEQPTWSSCDSECIPTISDEGNILTTGNFQAAGTTLVRLSPDHDVPAQLTFSTGVGSNIALSALGLGTPRALRFDDVGNLLLAHDNRIRWIGKTEMRARDLIGGPAAGTSGDYGPSTSALVQEPRDVATDGAGNVWFIEGVNEARLRRIWQPSAPFVTTDITLTVVSQGSSGFPGHRASAVQVEAKNQLGATLDGLPVFLDSGEAAVSRQGPTVTNGIGRATFQPWTSMFLGELTFTPVIEDLTGAVTASIDLDVDVVTPPAGTITSVVNAARATGSVILEGWAPAIAVPTPYGVATVSDGTAYISAIDHVYRLDPDGTLYDVLGGIADGISLITIVVSEQLELAYVASYDTIYRLDLASAALSAVTGGPGDSGAEGGPASEWSGDGIASLALSDDGTKLFFYSLEPVPALYRIDLDANPPTRSTVFAVPSDSFFGPLVCADHEHFPYISASENRGMTYGSDGLIYAVGDVCVGGSEVAYIYSLDPEGPGTATLLAPSFSSSTSSIARDADGRIFYTNGSSEVVVWDPQSGLMVIAGNGYGDGGDQGPASAALLAGPAGVALTPDGHLLVGDRDNSAIRKIWSP